LKILVTGGAGFIASHIVDAYLSAGHEVWIVDDLSSGKIGNVSPRAVLHQMDITAVELYELLLSFKPDIINHHAAQISVPRSITDPFTDVQTNIRGLVNLCEAAVKCGVKKIIFASSGGAIYGEPEEYPATERCPSKPLSIYAINKKASEDYLYFYSHYYGLDYTILRYANVYGPRQDPSGEAGVVSVFIEQLLTGKTPNLNAYPDDPDGMIRDYVFVRDVVNANLKALSKGSRDVFNIGTGIPIKTRELYTEINSQISHEIESVIEPSIMPARPGDVKRSLLNIDKARHFLDWYPQYGLGEGIRETVEFFKDKYTGA